MVLVAMALQLLWRRHAMGAVTGIVSIAVAVFRSLVRNGCWLYSLSCIATRLWLGGLHRECFDAIQFCCFVRGS